MRAVTRLAQRLAAPFVDLVYVYNRLACLSQSQGAFLGEEFPSESATPQIYPRDQCVRWDLDLLPAGASQHPQQKGLWIFPGALNAVQCAAIANEVARLTDNNGVQGEDGVAVQSEPSGVALPIEAPVAATIWSWFQYGPGRWMVPMQPSAGVCEQFARGPLSGLRSHNSTDARRWPKLSEAQNAGGDALRALEALPAESMPSAFGGRAPLFLQLQSLQRGASIGAHVDEHDVGGRAIMTAVVAGGGGDVRVGGVSFAVRAGDVYALCGDARDAIDHEVYYSACRADRLSVTVRYGGRSEDPYPFPCEKEAESLHSERRRVSVSESEREA